MTHLVRITMLLIIPVLCSRHVLADEPDFRFQEVVLDAEAAGKTCYAVVSADVDGDGRNDIVVVTDNRVQWYRCPEKSQALNATAWTKHIILDNQTELDNVCTAAHDIDGDGNIDFALGAGWTKVGTIQWISRSEDPNAIWKVHQIAVEPWTHRMRFADVLGQGKPQLVVSPLNATSGNGVRLTAYSIPSNPKTERWLPTIISDDLNRMHNHLHIMQNGVDSTITASQEGIFSFNHQATGEFRTQQITSGISGASPETSGAGEVKVGNLGNPHNQFLTSIEPMHGTHVVVYLMKTLLPTEKTELKRIILDDTFNQGHALFTADMNGDGIDEVIAAYREPGTGEIKGPGVFLYHAIDQEGSSWNKTIIDNGGMACEDLICEDFNHDGKPDIVAVGRKTKNVKLYINTFETK